MWVNQRLTRPQKRANDARGLTLERCRIKLGKQKEPVEAVRSEAAVRALASARKFPLPLVFDLKESTLPRRGREKPVTDYDQEQHQADKSLLRLDAGNHLIRLHHR
jgi:hypothetical protein